MWPGSRTTRWQPDAIAFSPDGKLLATANYDSSSVSEFSVDEATGALMPIPASPFATGSAPSSVAYSPSSRLLATGNHSDSVSVFAVDPSSGGLLEVTGSPFSTGAGSDPLSVAFSPGGGLLATADSGSDGVGMFTVDASPSSTAISAVAGTQFNGAVAHDGCAINGASATIDWGDGTPTDPSFADASGNVNGSHVYSAAGVYHGTVTINGGCGVGTFTATVTAVSTSSAAVSCSPGVVAVGEPTQCTATVGHSSGAGVPTGKITFGSQPAGPFSSGGACTLSGGSCAVAFTPTGADATITITAHYSGDSSHPASSAMTTVALAPTAGASADVTVISGTVRIVLPGGKSSSMVPGAGATVAVPTGSQIDTRKGAVRLATAADYLGARNRHHRVQNGTFSAGLFAIKQLTARQAEARARRQHHRHPGPPSTDLQLITAPSAPRRAGCQTTGSPGKGVVRSVTGVAKGLYRTLGIASTTTVTNGAWTVQDRCDGTLTRVRRGRATVSYRLHGRARIARLNAGQSILVRARFLAARRV